MNQKQQRSKKVITVLQHILTSLVLVVLLVSLTACSQQTTSPTTHSVTSPSSQNAGASVNVSADVSVKAPVNEIAPAIIDTSLPTLVNGSLLGISPEKLESQRQKDVVTIVEPIPPVNASVTTVSSSSTSNIKKYTSDDIGLSFTYDSAQFTLSQVLATNLALKSATTSEQITIVQVPLNSMSFDQFVAAIKTAPSRTNLSTVSFMATTVAGKDAVTISVTDSALTVGTVTLPESKRDQYFVHNDGFVLVITYSASPSQFTQSAIDDLIASVAFTSQGASQ